MIWRVAFLLGVAQPLVFHNSCFSRGLRLRASFEDLFLGDFDNYAQADAERAAGVLAADATGHEHVHCALRAIPAAHVARGGC